MPIQPTSCDSKRLQQLLAQQLAEPLEAEAVEHLSSCLRCQQELESMAGAPDWWSEVSVSLRDRSQQQASDPSICIPVFDESQPGELEECMAADFAVDFLQPCERPDALGRLDEVEILEVIGQGGMGILLKGLQPELGRHVAVKVMAPHLAVSGSARKRFAREARAAAAIIHPHVLPIHSVNSNGRLPYLVMPYIVGQSLQQRLDRDGPLELTEIVRIAMQTASALAAAHAQGLVHRDVKPANILLEKGVDRVLLTDFGLARAVDDASLTCTGVIAGTPQFMSPEQARGESLQHQTDLFSLGSVMYAMCTGRPPFRAETSLGVLRRITDSQPRGVREINPEIPDWLANLIDKLHAKEPAERYSSADEVARLLAQCLAHLQQPAVVSLPAELLIAGKDDRQNNRRWLWWIAAGSVLAVLLVMAAAVGTQVRSNSTNHSTDAVNPLLPSGQFPNQPAERRAADPVWDDQIDQQLLDLQDDIDRLELESLIP